MYWIKKEGQRNQPRQLPPLASPTPTTPAAPELSDEEKKEQTANWDAALGDLPDLFSEGIPESTGATVAREEKKRKGTEARAAARAKVAKIYGSFIEASRARQALEMAAIPPRQSDLAQLG